MKNIILAPFKWIYFGIRGFLAFILRNLFGCMVVYPKKPKYILRKKKNGK